MKQANYFTKISYLVFIFFIVFSFSCSKSNDPLPVPTAKSVDTLSSARSASFLSSSTTTELRIPVYRYNSSVEHFYTIDFNELGNGGNGWTYEGIAYYVYPFNNPTPSSVVSPAGLARFYKAPYHMYTGGSEVSALDQEGWNFESEIGYVSNGIQDNGSIPVYRYYNGSHFWTTNWNELGAGRNGWTYEGIHFYAWSTAQ
jgi:hypothetical protein